MDLWLYSFAMGFLLLAWLLEPRRPLVTGQSGIPIVRERIAECLGATGVVLFLVLWIELFCWTLSAD